VTALVIAGISVTVTLTVAVGHSFGTWPDLDLKVKNVDWLVKAVQLAVLLISIVLHECAHGLAAWWAGDTTARDQGRLTLNPIPHIDLFGSIVLPAIMALLPGGLMFGWAKPVPVNPLRFRRSRLGNLGVSLAGVSVNLMLALFCAGALTVLAIGLRAAYPELTVSGFHGLWQPTRFTGVPNAGTWELITEALKHGLLINLVLANLNILPIPPLDGFHVVQALLPERLAEKLNVLNSFGFLIFIALLFLNVINYLLLPGLLVALILLQFASAAGGMA
jgi:Zn-dependent protease